MNNSGSISLTNQAKANEDSIYGKFGWTTIYRSYVPYIFRNEKKYCSMRMAKMKIFDNYTNLLHPDIYNCACIKSYYINEAERNLLNEINCRHCDYQFGTEPFTLQDIIVRLSDVVEFSHFLNACYCKLNGNQNITERCGFIQIDKESVIAYTFYHNQRYVPLFYFEIEGEMEDLKSKVEKLKGWSLSYLKFCCKVQGIRQNLFDKDSCDVVKLNDIKSSFPPGTLFEDYWPSQVNSQLLINGKT